MPNKGIRNAVYKRAGGKGQSSKFYNIYGKVVKPTDPTGFKGGQGWTAPKPQIGSMLSLGIMKQNRNAGGNNVCQPGPGPKLLPTLDINRVSNTMTVGRFPPTGNPNPIAFIGVDTATPFGSFGSSSFVLGSGQVLNTVSWMVATVTGGSQNFQIQVSNASSYTTIDQSSFNSISFVNCDDNSVRTYKTSDSTFQIDASADLAIWTWAATTTAQQLDNLNYWSNTIGKTLGIVVDVNPALINAQDYCVNNDCKCRGPSGQCPCRKGGC